MSTPSSPRKPALSAPAEGADHDPTEQNVAAKPSSPTRPPQPNYNHVPADFPIDENLFGEPPIIPFPTDGNPEGPPYEDPQDDGPPLLPPPDFKPFFTLIEDRETGAIHHPTVHYLFADDDPDLATTAALESLAANSPDPSTTASGGGGGGGSGGGGNPTTNHPEEHLSPATTPTDVVILLDLAADGRSVAGISSLSPEWQAVRTAVTQAPSWGEGGEGEDGERGLMLRISGQGRAKVGKRDRRVGKEAVSVEALEEMIVGFDERLGELSGVLGVGEGGEETGRGSVEAGRLN